MEKLHSTTKDIIEENSNRAQQIEVSVWDFVAVRQNGFGCMEKERLKGQREPYSGYICPHASGFISGGGSVLALQV